MSGPIFRFSRTYSLLQDEGYLIYSSLTYGLTQIRNGVITDKGSIYAALFNTGIGIERLQKIVYIIDYMFENELRAPDEKQIRKFGHELDEDDLIVKIISFLSNFNNGTRYYNFNNLKLQKGSNPIREWCEILFYAGTKNISKKKMESIMKMSSELGLKLSEVAISVRRGSDEYTLSHEEMLSATQIQTEASKYVVKSILEFLSEYRSLLSRMCHKAYFLGVHEPVIPQMQEFLDWVAPEPEFCLRKKKWP